MFYLEGWPAADLDDAALSEWLKLRGVHSCEGRLCLLWVVDFCRSTSHRDRLRVLTFVQAGKWVVNSRKARRVGHVRVSVLWRNGGRASMNHSEHPRFHTASVVYRR